MKVRLPIDDLFTVHLSDIDYTASPYHPATFNDPAEGGFESVDAVWMKFPDKNGNEVMVNVVEMFDQETLIDLVTEALDERDSGI